MTERELEDNISVIEKFAIKRFLWWLKWVAIITAFILFFIYTFGSASNNIPYGTY